MRALLALFLVGACLAARAEGPAPRPLPTKELKQLRKGPCTLFYWWATWCQPCIVELPHVLEWAKKLEGVRIVVIDASSPFAQKQFSVKWVTEALKPSFQTYLRPAGVKDHHYFEALDPRWPHVVPYAVLYRNGKLAQRWSGLFDKEKAGREIAAACRANKK